MNFLHFLTLPLSLVSALALTVSPSLARDLQPRPDDPVFTKYEAFLAPAPGGLLLQKGDRLAICGDSITEQKMYSRIIETYLTVCVPELEVTCRQFGWSGEQANGFLGRMENDVLRFHPTVATTCYGMNDHHYVPWSEDMEKAYRENQLGIVQKFKASGVRVVLGSPGTIGKMPGWVKTATGTVDDLNLSLMRLRNADIEMAEAEGVRFADVWWPMMTAGVSAQKKYGPDFMVSGKDGVHPGWAGQVVMAYAYLRALGVDGETGTFTVDLSGKPPVASPGHEITGWENGTLSLKSRAYPFCAAEGDVAKDDNLRAGMALVPFHDELNRFTLKVTGASAPQYDVTWGATTQTFSAAELGKGVNLAAAFADNPFVPAFTRVWDAVFAKQDYETRQIKQIFHGPEGGADPDAAAALTEKVRAPLAGKIRAAFTPVEHAIRIVPHA